MSFLKYSVLSLEVSAHISSELPLWSIDGSYVETFFVYDKSTGNNYYLLVRIHGMVLTLLTIPGMLIINKSSTLDSCVHLG